MHLIQATKAFFRVLAKGEKAAPPPPPEGTFQASAEPAVQLLGLLQKEGRLIDFLQEDISSFSDADIGAAVRPIHAGCRKVLEERFTLEHVREEDESATVTVEEDFDASAVSLTGNVSGDAPHTGRLVHRGWRAAETRLPTVAPGTDPKVVQPAEVEVQ